MRRSLLLLLFVAACGGSSTPASTAPPPPAPAPVGPAPGGAPPATNAPPPAPAGAAPFPVLPILASPACVVRGSAPALAEDVVLAYRGKAFGRIRAPESIELHLGANGTGTVAAQTKKLEIAGEVDPRAIMVSPVKSIVKDGWISVDWLKIRQVGANGDIAGTAMLPRIIANAPPVEVTSRCAETTLTNAKSPSGAMRLFKRPITTTLREAPNGKVLATLTTPPKVTGPLANTMVEVLPYVARILEERGKDAKVAIWDRGTHVEGWIDASALVPATDRDAQATVLAAQAESQLVGMATLAVLGGGPSPDLCQRPLNVFVRNGGATVAVGAIRQHNAISRSSTKAPDQKPGEVPIDLEGSGLVPFILESSMDACKIPPDTAPLEVTVKVAPDRGLVAANVVPPAPASASGSSVKVEGPKGEVAIGPIAMSPSIPDGEAMVHKLKPRFRQCYQLGVNGDPQMSGKLVMTVKVGPTGEVQSAIAAANTGLSQGVAACVASAFKRADFSKATTLTSIQVPLSFALAK